MLVILSITAFGYVLRLLLIWTFWQILRSLSLPQDDILCIRRCQSKPLDEVLD